MQTIRYVVTYVMKVLTEDPEMFPGESQRKQGRLSTL